MLQWRNKKKFLKYTHATLPFIIPMEADVLPLLDSKLSYLTTESTYFKISSEPTLFVKIHA